MIGICQNKYDANRNKYNAYPKKRMLCELPKSVGIFEVNTKFIRGWRKPITSTKTISANYIAEDNRKLVKSFILHIYNTLKSFKKFLRVLISFVAIELNFGIFIKYRGYLIKLKELSMGMLNVFL